MSRSSHLTRWDALKLIGLALMFIDHAGYFFFPEHQWIRGIGRACAPIFLFLAGFAPHYRFDQTLLLYATLLTGSDWLLHGAPNTLNILWTIILIRLLLAQLERRGMLRLRLHEWVMGSIALIPLVLVVQYGTFGLLFALSGYVYKHRAAYNEKTPQRFLLSVTLIYAVAVPVLSEFHALTSTAMGASLLVMLSIILWFTREPKAAVCCPAPLLKPAQLCSRHTALIYAVHLMILGWITGLPI